MKQVFCDSVSTLALARSAVRSEEEGDLLIRERLLDCLYAVRRGMFMPSGSEEVVE